MKKLNLSEKAFFFILLAAFVLAMIPVYRIALYACPFYDDYNYSIYVKTYYSQMGLKGVFVGMYETMKGFWWAWQGTFSSAAFMSLAGMSFGEQYYFLGVWAVITVISLGTFCFTYTVLKNTLGADFYKAASMGILVTLLLLEFIHTSYQGLFWYNSAVHYTFMHGIMFFMLAAAIKTICSKKIVGAILFTLLTMILGFISSGANFVTSLQGLLLLITVMALGLFFKRKKSFFLIAPILLYAYGFKINVKAPGNSVRQAYFEGEGAVKAILDSFLQAIKDIPKFTGLAGLVVICVMIPTIVEIVKKSEYDFKLPGLISALSFCMYATGYTSSFYSWSSGPIDRTMVNIKFTYQILLVANIVYWTGWIVKKLEFEPYKLKHNVIFYLFFAFLLSLCFMFSKDQAGGYLSYGSYYYTHTCFAQNFREEYLRRIDIIKNSDGGEVAVPPIWFRPWLLIGNAELSEDSSAEPNTCMARYYGVESIYLDRNYGEKNE